MMKLAKKIFPKKELVGKQTVTKRKRDFRFLLLILLGSFLALSTLVKLQPSLAIDLYITLFVQKIDFFGFDFLMRDLTFLGNQNPVTVSISVFVIFLFAINRKKEGLLLILSSAGAATISTLAKTIIARPRPDPNIIHQIGTFAYSDSFPSGHVLVFMGLYGFLLFLAFTRLKKSFMRTIIIDILLIILFLIGVSRIYLGAHWFSDVLGSYLIGGVWIYCMTKIDSRFKARDQKLHL